MSNKSLNVDPRILPLVRSLKEQNEKSSENYSKKIQQYISSEKTSDSTKIKKITENKNIIENEKNKNDEKEKPKKKNSINRFTSKANTTIKKSVNTKISIDGSLEHKTKSGTSENQRGLSQTNNKIQIVSKTKDQSKAINLANTFQFTSGQLRDNNFHNIKTRSKYVQNLLNDMSLKKYKNSCIDIVKNDNVVKKLYEESGFEKTNYSYENFIQNNFFNNPLFMYKLEMLFLDQSNFTKKNFKENFFKNEIIKYLNNYNHEDIYQKQINNLHNVFKEGFDSILNLDLFHE